MAEMRKTPRDFSGRCVYCSVKGDDHTETCPYRRCEAQVEGERCRLPVGHLSNHDYEWTMER